MADPIDLRQRAAWTVGALLLVAVAGMALALGRIGLASGLLLPASLGLAIVLLPLTDGVERATGRERTFVWTVGAAGLLGMGGASLVLSALTGSTAIARVGLVAMAVGLPAALAVLHRLAGSLGHRAATRLALVGLLLFAVGLLLVLTVGRDLDGAWWRTGVVLGVVLAPLAAAASVGWAAWEARG